MLATLVIFLREGVEASMIVAILLASNRSCLNCRINLA